MGTARQSSGGPSPRFSILVPTRDRPEWVKGCVRSVLDQTFEGFELVVYDNGQPIRHLLPKDPRIRYLHGPASGAADACNRALEVCRGEIVTRLNDDDRITPDALEIVDREIGNTDWLVGLTSWQTPDGASIRVTGRKPPRRMSDRFGLGGAVYWRKALTDQLGGFDPEFETAEDFDLFARFARHTEAVFIERVLYLHTVHPEQASKTRRAEQKAAGRRIREREASC